MAFRVVRVLEYEYDSIDTFMEDSKHWTVPANGIKQMKNHKRLVIRSATTPVSELKVEDEQANR